MKNDHRRCDAEALSRFLDNEGGAQETDRLRRHLETCGACRKRLAKQRLLSRLARKAVAGETARADFERLEAAVVSAVHRQRPYAWQHFTGWIPVKKVSIPLATAVLAGLVYFFVAVQRPGFRAPSAIINSFTGPISSVMIIETPETRQTILWFDENSAATDDDKAV